MRSLFVYAQPRAEEVCRESGAGGRASEQGGRHGFLYTKEEILEILENGKNKDIGDDAY